MENYFGIDSNEIKCLFGRLKYSGRGFSGVVSRSSTGSSLGFSLFLLIVNALGWC